MAEAQITNPLGAFPVSGSTAAQSTVVGPQTKEMKASTTITALQCVSIATDGTYQVAPTATNGTTSLVRGIALNSVTSGQVCDVQVAGLVKSVPVDGTVAAGDVLKRSTTTAGKLATTATPAFGDQVAVALAASASNVVDVWVTKD